jgi:hypothetical protein
MRYITLAMILGACASSAPPQQEQATARPPGTYQLATRPDCEKLVDHLDEIRFLSGSPAPRDVFRAQNQSPNWHRSRVDTCTISVDPHDYACLMRARDLTTAQYCNSRFFASTMESYRVD